MAKYTVTVRKDGKVKMASRVKDSAGTNHRKNTGWVNPSELKGLIDTIRPLRQQPFPKVTNI